MSTALRYSAGGGQNPASTANPTSPSPQYAATDHVAILSMRKSALKHFRRGPCSGPAVDSQINRHRVLSPGADEPPSMRPVIPITIEHSMVMD